MVSSQINSSPEPIVRVRSLTKTYAQLDALKSVSFDIYPGDIFGIIGPDGAGKTTAFHILGGILEKTAGEVIVLGGNPKEKRLDIGYLTQVFSLYQDLSINENIDYIAGLREVAKKDFLERKEKYLKLMDLYRFGNRLAGKLSGGMKQKLALCCALISRPKLLLLDEPTTGVDPVSRREFWDLLSTVRDEGVTIAVATPYLDEAERCSRLILLHEGEIQQTGSPSQLKESLHLRRLELRSQSLVELEAKISSTASNLIADIQTLGDRIDVLSADPKEAAKIIETDARELNISDLRIDLQDPSLENVFVNLLKGKVNLEYNLGFPFVKKARTNNSGNGSEDGTNNGAIHANSITKEFGDFKAVNNVSITVKYGQIYGLLGANGAGKTTTIKMLCGLLMPNHGTISLAGQSDNLRSESLRQKLGYMSQKFTLYEDLTILENLEFYCGVYLVPQKLRKERINWVLRNSGLVGQEHLITAKLPGGWKQRLSFGAAVMHEPDVLFLDEPTSGVDPLARRQMWSLIRQMASHGTAILVTTHFLEEAEYCNKLGFMANGQLVAEGSPSSIKAGLPGTLIEMHLSNLAEGYELAKRTIEPWRVTIFGDTIHLVLDNPEEDLAIVERQLDEHNIKILSKRSLPFSLEDSFISIVQRNKGDTNGVEAA